ncbi:mediator of RNA polymerase II transcription subunit 16 [Drosophila grimshawi]|uniref:Mediator of RNA polymerase II transcription subunit 16 n=1 Tax=Drosophila grimshawi TaxID=7222 RepID=B4JWM0_DROGR|nr:mediator of RNA polymerase II transcription subunit 16 [Drosophila grimshawi]XP_032596941.1 mediator of RNA polymerase II transcription subunit 16 [Drosophila grimshawi]EDV98358.1 GH23074 [Drosophila grimshawi]
MTILYKVESRREFGNAKDSSVFPHKVVLCAVSARNIIAFSALQSLSTHVYVCDIVTPWQYYKVCVSKSLINVLAWSASGEQLLLGFIGGRVEIWQPREQALNVWQLHYFAHIPSEDIIEARFFHNGKGVHFNAQKKDHIYYAEKFERLDQRPTLTGFGGVATEGCILLTSSGLLAAFTLSPLQKQSATGNSPPDPATLHLTNNNTNSSNSNSCSGSNNSEQIELIPATHSIGISRSYIEHCSILASASGALNIAYSIGWQQQQQLVHCFKVSLQLDGKRISIKSESLASIFLQPLESSRRISQLLWTRLGNDDVIYVVFAGSEQSSLLEQWTLTRRHQNVHALLQQQSASSASASSAATSSSSALATAAATSAASGASKPSVDCESWEQVAKLQLNANIAQLCCTRLAGDSEQLYVILQDNSVQVLEPGTLKQLQHTQFERGNSSSGNDASDVARFVCADLTPTSQMLLIFDSHAQLHAMQTPVLLKQSATGSMQLLLLLLEYCIVTGVDASDVLLLNLGNLEALVEKLTENFTRQPSYVRQFYYANFLALKSNLCRAQQQEFDNLIILHAISSTFKSLLRPSDLGCQDKGPADNLAMKLAESVPDVDNVMLNLDPKDFTVEPMMLQSLQQLIQWVTDLALNMLNRLPDEVIKCKLAGKRQGSYDISRDIVAISSLRELLVMIRIWGLLNPQCLPVYTKTMENIDVLAILFRLLTRLAQNVAEPDELLLDECSLLSKQLLIPQLARHNPTTLLSAQGYAAVKSGQLTFTSLVEPVGLQDIEMEQVVFANCVKDGVSNLQLGANPSTIRRCARCGFVNSANKVAKTSALKAWCNKWLHCHCGGFWKQIN